MSNLFRVLLGVWQAEDSAFATHRPSKIESNDISASGAVEVRGTAPVAESTFDVDLSDIASGASFVQVVAMNLSSSTSTDDYLLVRADITSEGDPTNNKVLPKSCGIPAFVFSMEIDGGSSNVIKLQAGGTNTVDFCLIAYAIA